MLRCASCGHCCSAVNRRRFLQQLSAGAAAGTAALLPRAGRGGAGEESRQTRVAAVFLANIDVHEIWPYPGFDTDQRQREVMARLRAGCPQLEFVEIKVTDPTDVSKALACSEQVDGYLVYMMTLDWRQNAAAQRIAALRKPTVLADEFLGGSGGFLTVYGGLRDQQLPVAPVASRRLEDLVAVVRVFQQMRSEGMSPAQFVRRCQEVYRATFPPRGPLDCTDDPVALTELDECLERFRKARFLVLGRGQPGAEQSFLGAVARYAGFEELQSLYESVDLDEAREWVARWTRQATPLPDGDYVEPSRPEPGALQRSARIYLATQKLLEKHGTDTVTMNCLGGFASGQLPAYPCFGFMQLLNDGGQGVCEAMPDDTLSMLMARILTGRPGFVSDPVLDTSTSQIVYAHCVGTTRVFGPDGPANDYRIRTLHNRDPRGACVESLMPAGYMTTSFRTSVAHKQMVIHQAKALGPLDSERGCRTKLVGDVRGDIGKLFNYWTRFGWHRVTVYGDVKEPLMEFGRALGLQVIEEA